MGFLGVYKAIYNYMPQAEGELQISEGDVLYVLEKNGEDDWWKAKKKASADDDDEPVGLIPNNYVEEVQPAGHARALYEYTRQTDEELSFPEDAQLDVFDTSDPDWILVGHDSDFGFAPANYIELGNSDGEWEIKRESEQQEQEKQSREQEYTQEQQEQEPEVSSVPALPMRPADRTASPPLPPRNVPPEPSSPVLSDPATALAGVIAGRSASSAQPRPFIAVPSRPSYVSDGSEEEPKSPPLPTRPRGASYASADTTSGEAYQSPSREHAAAHSAVSRQAPQQRAQATPAALTPDSFHMYNISEMVSIMGKKKKMPTTLGINLKTGVILIAPEHAQDGPSMEWSADRMTHYSREGKHIFMELVRPSKSVDFHAGAKDTAEEIVNMLGELAGAVRAGGLREVMLASRGQTLREGVVLYDFMAQGDDEVTVAVGDKVVVLDDSKSEEWWQVRRVKNGKEGVVPSSYIEVKGSVTGLPEAAAGAAAVPASMSGINAGRSTVEQNRLEEQRLTKEAIRAGQREDQKERERERRASEVGPGMRLPDRSSSLSSTRDGNNAAKQRSRRDENGGHGDSTAGGTSKSNKTKPDPSKVRTWTDRSKSFSVEAQFLALKDSKLHLHKMNGVKIAVPVAKMSLEDLEYVERITGQSLDEDKPLSGLRRPAASEPSRGPAGRVGVTVEQPGKPEYDWFQFFLSCDVNPGLCDRYAKAFAKESMDESVLPDVNDGVLRNLGLREGDIIKVMRFLDNKYGRSKKSAAAEDIEGGLFSGPGGTLRNNTRKGRPAPPVETSNVIDPRALSQGPQEKEAVSLGVAASPAAAPSDVVSIATSGKRAGGFDDDAWDIKPSKSQTAEPAAQTAQLATRTLETAGAPTPTTTQTPDPNTALVAAPVPKPAALTGSMQELSLLTQPLQPEKPQPPAPPPALSLAPAAVSSPQPQLAPTPAMVSQPPGATPSFFGGMPQQQQQGQVPQTMVRQRPGVPQYTQGSGGLMPPPTPARSLSAPQSAQPSVFPPPPLQPQMTGYQPQQQLQPQVTGYQPQQVGPAGQSLNEIAQVRMLQQQYAQPLQPIMPMMTGMQPPQGFGQTPFIPQPTGMVNGAPQQFGPLSMQPTGFAAFSLSPQPPLYGGPANSFLPPPLEPQRTGMASQTMQLQQPQPTGVIGGFVPPGFVGSPPGMQALSTNNPGNNGSNNTNNNSFAAPIQHPLFPQKTGPPPPVRFGVTNEPSKKLAPQPTGRRANLAQATPQNPFGF